MKTIYVRCPTYYLNRPGNVFTPKKYYKAKMVGISLFQLTDERGAVTRFHLGRAPSFEWTEISEETYRKALPFMQAVEQLGQVKELMQKQTPPRKPWRPTFSHIEGASIAILLALSIAAISLPEVSGVNYLLYITLSLTAFWLGHYIGGKK